MGNVILLQAPESQCCTRTQERKVKNKMPIEIRRDDGNVEIFNERYGFFKEKTSCVVDELGTSGVILKIDSSRDEESVYEDFVLAIKEGVDADYFERYMPKFRNHCELVLVVDDETN